MFNNQQSSAINLEVTLVPWSVNISHGNSKWENICNSSLTMTGTMAVCVMVLPQDTESHSLLQPRCIYGPSYFSPGAPPG